MSRRVWIALVLLALAAGGGRSAEPSCCGPNPLPWRQRLRPAGGWAPYGSLLHWWNPCWFPRGGAPDDYCRKPLPCFGWPAYPPCYKIVPQCCAPAEAVGGAAVEMAPLQQQPQE